MIRPLALLGIGSLLLAAFFLQPCVAQSVEQENGMQLAATSQAGHLLYSNDFVTRKESKWYTATDDNLSRFYKDGKYHMLLRKNGWSAWSFAGLNLRDFILDVYASQEESPDDNDYGVVTRYKDAGNFSLFLISGDGYFGYARKENGIWVVPTNWTRSEAVNKGNALNRIKVIANGNDLEFYANDELLGQFRDENPLFGDIGFWAESFDEGNVHVSFDNLKLYEMAAPRN